MEILVSVLLILGALLVGAASPGPSFVLIARIAMGISRRDGIAASVGMGVGGMIFSILALFGLHAVLTNVPALYLVLKVMGGMYLIYIAIRIWRSAKEPLAVTSENEYEKSSLKKSFLIGLLTQISNPKTAIVYGSIMAALLPANIPTTLYYILPPLVFLIEAGWYLVVTLVLSGSSPRAMYIQSKSLFDRLAGGIMAGLGVKLVSTVADY